MCVPCCSVFGCTRRLRRMDPWRRDISMMSCLLRGTYLASINSSRIYVPYNFCGRPITRSGAVHNVTHPVIGLRLNPFTGQRFTQHVLFGVEKNMILCCFLGCFSPESRCLPMVGKNVFQQELPASACRIIRGREWRIPRSFTASQTPPDRVDKPPMPPSRREFAEYISQQPTTTNQKQSWLQQQASLSKFDGYRESEPFSKVKVTAAPAPTACSAAPEAGRTGDVVYDPHDASADWSGFAPRNCVGRRMHDGGPPAAHKEVRKSL